MTNPLITRLRLLTSLSDGELHALADELTVQQVAPARADLVPEGHGTDHLHILVDGWACRYRLLGDGRRQLPALLVPGDICDIDAFLLRRVHYGVAALTPCKVAILPHVRLRVLIDGNPAMRDVFWWLTFVENGMSAECSVGLGRRSTQERFAHLLCELQVRLAAVGLTTNHSFWLPLTQDELADVLGVSAVHVNRTLQELRGTGLVSLESRRLTIHDWDALKALAGFTADHLHTEGMRPADHATQH